MPGAFMVISRTARGRTKLGEMLKATELAKLDEEAAKKKEANDEDHSKH